MIVRRDSVDHHSRRWAIMMKNRIISGIIACCYLVAAFIAKGPLMTFRMSGFLILPLACIWFSNEMGGFTGTGFGRGSITEKSPGWAVAFVGWLLLLLPVFVGIIVLTN
jgi:hypothetical protein